MKTGRDVKRAYLRLDNLRIEIMTNKEGIKTLEDIRERAKEMKATLSAPLVDLWKKLQVECSKSGITKIDGEGYLIIDEKGVLTTKEEELLEELDAAMDDVPAAICV